MLVTNLPHMTENTYTAELHSALEQEKKKWYCFYAKDSWTALDVICNVCSVNNLNFRFNNLEF